MPHRSGLLGNMEDGEALEGKDPYQGGEPRHEAFFQRLEADDPPFLEDRQEHEECSAGNRQAAPTRLSRQIPGAGDERGWLTLETVNERQTTHIWALLRASCALRPPDHEASQPLYTIESPPSIRTTS